MQQLPAALKGLARYERFLICKLRPRKDSKGNVVPNKMDKIPLNPSNLRPHDPSDPAVWLSAQAAIDMYNQMGEPDRYVVGFWFSNLDPFFFLDIDGAYSEDGWNDISKQMIQSFPGAAVEVSHSRMGLHIIATGYCPPHGCTNKKLGLELYTKDRFVALTGLDAQGDCNLDFTPQLAWLVEHFFSGNAAVDDGEWNNEHVSGSDPLDDDDVLINKAMASQSIASKFGTKASFKALWEADETELSKYYPHDTHPWDGSSADMALAQHLAFWTGGNHDRILRLMERSALKRPKWEDRKEYYLPMTIRRAVSQQGSYYNKNYRRDEPETDNPVENPTVQQEPAAPSMRKPSLGIVFDKDMQQMFSGFVYVAEPDVIIDTATGAQFKQSQFKNYFAGCKFVYTTEGKTTEDAWKAFVGNQVITFPKAVSWRLNPAVKSGIIYFDEDTKLETLNTFIPHNPALVSGDASPFLDLLERMLPIDRDRDILLSYAAAAVQNPGHKFRYAPVLQGTQGNGKSTFGKVLEYCLGKRYTYYPKAAQIVQSAGKFNLWLANNLIIIVEEINKPRQGTKGATEFDSTMKQFITQDRAEIEGKGANQRMEPVLANFFFITNDPEHFPIVAADRRYTMLKCAQQSPEDLKRDGMDNEYWSLFFNWFYNEGGLAIAANYLMEYEINAEFNPLLTDRAPLSSAHTESIRHGLSHHSELLSEAVDEEAVGFRNGWISSHMARQWLEHRGLREIGPRTISKAIAELGYIKHPYLPNSGKVNRAIDAEEGTRPILYVEQASILCNLKDPNNIQDRYMQDQGYAKTLAGAKNFASS